MNKSFQKSHLLKSTWVHIRVQILLSEITLELLWGEYWQYRLLLIAFLFPPIVHLNQILNYKETDPNFSIHEKKKKIFP